MYPVSLLLRSSLLLLFLEHALHVGYHLLMDRWVRQQSNLVIAHLELGIIALYVEVTQLSYTHVPFILDDFAHCLP